jgi:hypothetical protein
MGANGQSLDPLLPTISQETVFEWPDPIIPKPSMSESPDDMEYLKLILNSRVYDVAHETPLTLASKVSLDVA